MGRSFHRASTLGTSLLDWFPWDEVLLEHQHKCQSDPILSCGLFGSCDQLWQKNAWLLLVSALKCSVFLSCNSTFCFPNIAIVTIPAASLINYFRPKGAVESVFLGEKRLNSASVPENNLRVKITIELVNTRFKLLSNNFTLST